MLDLGGVGLVWGGDGLDVGGCRRGGDEGGKGGDGEEREVHDGYGYEWVLKGV